MPYLPLEGKQLWFRSPLFDIVAGEDKDTNPHCYGRSFANWLVAQLRDKGINVVEVFPEDWGWCIMVKKSPFYLWIGCGNYDYEPKRPEDSLPKGEDLIWTCIFVADVPLLKRLFRAPDTASEVDALYAQVQHILANARGTSFIDSP